MSNSQPVAALSPSEQPPVFVLTDLLNRIDAATKDVLETFESISQNVSNQIQLATVGRRKACFQLLSPQIMLALSRS